MNERIRELYNQSLEEKYQYGGSDAKPGEMYSNYITVLNPEKFALLIVQECIDMISPYTVRMSRPGEEYLHPIQEIKQHFGVKE
jgi:hypothetical protein